MNSINKILQARADYQAMLIAEEKLKPLIMKNKYKRSPKLLTFAMDLILNRKENIEIKNN